MYIIHQTPEIVAIVTLGTSNRKTGNMLQIWILDARMKPSESRATGADALNQCAGCAFASNKGCYVDPRALASIFGAWQRGSYSPLEMGSPEWAQLFDNADVRLGAYGNPSKLPIGMLSDICERSRMHTGYFHDWAQMPESEAVAYGKFLMASCELDTVTKAQAIGLRTFTVVPKNLPVPPQLGIECLSDSKGMQCIECGLCDGTARSSTRSKALPHVWIGAHGYQVRKAEVSAVK